MNFNRLNLSSPSRKLVQLKTPNGSQQVVNPKNIPLPGNKLVPRGEAKYYSKYYNSKSSNPYLNPNLRKNYPKKTVPFAETPLGPVSTFEKYDEQVRKVVKSEKNFDEKLFKPGILKRGGLITDSPVIQKAHPKKGAFDYKHEPSFIYPTFEQPIIKRKEPHRVDFHLLARKRK